MYFPFFDITWFFQRPTRKTGPGVRKSVDINNVRSALLLLVRYMDWVKHIYINDSITVILVYYIVKNIYLLQYKNSFLERLIRIFLQYQ